MGFVSLGATWQTVWNPAAVPVTAIAPFLTETLTSKFNLLQNESLQGYGGPLPGDQGVETLMGTTEHHLNYNSMDIFIAAGMGLLTGSVITIAEEVTDKYYGIEFDKGVKRYCFGPCKVNKFTISGEKDKYCKATFDWYGRDFSMIDTTFPTLAQPTNVLVPFDDLVFRLADQLNAIADGDSMGLESFEITFDRVYKADDYESSATTPRQPLEPIAGGWRATELSIKIPRYNANTIAAWKDAYTALQMDMRFTGPATNYKKIEMPELRISDGFNQNISGPTPLTVEGKFKAYRSVAGNPMYANGNEMRVLIA
jgi:hypothetical protein